VEGARGPSQTGEDHTYFKRRDSKERVLQIEKMVGRPPTQWKRKKGGQREVETGLVKIQAQSSGGGHGEMGKKDKRVSGNDEDIKRAEEEETRLATGGYGGSATRGPREHFLQRDRQKGQGVGGRPAKDAKEEVVSTFRPTDVVQRSGGGGERTKKLETCSGSQKRVWRRNRGGTGGDEVFSTKKKITTFG